MALEHFQTRIAGCNTVVETWSSLEIPMASLGGNAHAQAVWDIKVLRTQAATSQREKKRLDCIITEAS
jgi:hypothetical protein